MKYVWSLIVTALAVLLTVLMDVSAWWGAALIGLYLIGYAEGYVVALLRYVIDD